jgi:hypothetical protein
MALNFLLLKEFHELRTFGKLKGLQFNHILYDYLSNKNKVVSIEYDTKDRAVLTNNNTCKCNDITKCIFL